MKPIKKTLRDNLFISFHSPFFLSGLLIKLIIGTIFISTIKLESFIPFVNFFVESNFSNPYLYFYEQGNYNIFPYPSFLLYTLAAPRILLGFSEVGNIHLLSFMMTIPLLVADVSIYLILKSWLRDNHHKILTGLYWFSPVLIYLSYYYGGLDVIPIALLFISLSLLFKEKYFASSVFLGFALSSKLIVISSLPFLLLYFVSKKISIKELIIFFSSSLGIFLLLNLPFIFNESFIPMVLLNSGQNSVFDFAIKVGDLMVFIVPVAFLILMFRGFLIRNFYKDTFLMFLAFGYGIFLLFIPPIQHWYFWLIPFLVYFYSKIAGRSIYLFALLQISFFIFFLFIPESDYLRNFQLVNKDISTIPNLYFLLGNKANIVLGFSFTFLQVILFLNIYWVYQKGIKVFEGKKIYAIPFLVGIGGNSGVGKTMLANSLQKIFTASNTAVIKGDDMHKWKRGDTNWKNYTHLDPKANQLHNEINMLKILKSGKSIYRDIYDHKDGNFKLHNLINPKGLIIHEGLHPFYLESQRKEYDFKIFINPDDALNTHWKILRDNNQRGKTKEDALNQIEQRKNDYNKYLKPQMEYADLILSPKPKKTLKEFGSSEPHIELDYSLNLSNSIYIEGILARIASIETVSISHDYLENGQQKLDISGTISSNDIDNINTINIDYLEDLGINFPKWPDGLYGLVLILIVYIIFLTAEESLD